jgi:hypothetical protein
MKSNANPLIIEANHIYRGRSIEIMLNGMQSCLMALSDNPLTEDSYMPMPSNAPIQSNAIASFCASHEIREGAVNLPKVDHLI